MNRAQVPTYEPTGIGLRWNVADMLKHRTEYHLGPLAAEISTEPSLRSATSKKLWAVICAATDPLEKSQWMNMAGLRGKIFRSRGSSSIINFRDNGWVLEREGRFSRINRG